MHVRVLLSRYRAYTQCPDCQGQRLQPQALLYRLKSEFHHGSTGATTCTSINLAQFYALPIHEARRLLDRCSALFADKRQDPLRLAAEEVRHRLTFLDEVGLGYLTVDRPTRSLSGGETERVNLTTCLGTRLVNTLFVLDEPSVGLHPRDTDRLVRILKQLRDAGNTVVVVEHEASVMRAANQIVDLGPGHGASGGQVVFQGSYADILKCADSLTGAYLSHRKMIDNPTPRPVELAPFAAASAPANGARTDSLRIKEAILPYRAEARFTPALKLSNASRHNLKQLTVEIPLGRLVCITGVSGSGKTTLVREVLLPAIAEQLKVISSELKASDRFSLDQNGEESEETEVVENARAVTIEGAEHLGRVVLVDQSILGKTPRSNPAVYIGAFDDIREVFAQSEPARQRGLNASAFSFNSSQGQCQRCHGAGFEKIEMQFLSDVFIRCPDCNGRRYRDHILEIRIGAPDKARSIGDLLEATIDEVVDFLSTFTESRPARRAVYSLKYLQEVGLGYLKLGQPINTLSGGESQRLKLVRHLAESCEQWDSRARQPGVSSDPQKPTLFLFDEPTTGLHFEDVRVLLQAFQRLIDQGHSVLVIEHNLEVVKCADWIIDLGPEGGEQGGELVVAGTPPDVAGCEASYTGQALRQVLTPPPPTRNSGGAPHRTALSKAHAR
jgi:excinuclease ABC subunit A